MTAKDIRESLVRFHDSKLNAVRILDNSRVQLSFRAEDEHPYDLVLYDVVYFKCDNFLEGNIVFDVEQVEPDAIESREIEALLHPKEGQRTEHSSKILSQIGSGALKFLRVTSSYGAEINSICRRLDVIESETN